MKQQTNWQGFDDCAICQAMRKAEERGSSLSEKELLQAFAEQTQKKGDEKF